MRDLICVLGKASRWGSAYLKRFTCVKGGAGSLVTGGFMYGMLVCRGRGGVSLSIERVCLKG